MIVSRQGSLWTDLSPQGRWLLVLTTLQTLGGGLTIPFLMVYLHEVRGFSEASSGVLITLIGVGAVATTALSGLWIDRYGAISALVVGTCTLAAANVLVAVAVSPGMAAVGLLMQGFNVGLTFPAKNAMAALLTYGELRQKFFALHFALLSLSMGVGGIIGGLFVDVSRSITFVALFLADAALMLTCVGIALGPLRTSGGRPRDISSDRSNDTQLQTVPPTSYLQMLRRRGVAPLAVIGFVASFVGYGQLEAGFPAFARDVSDVSTRVIGFAFALNTWLIVVLQMSLLRRMKRHPRSRLLIFMAATWVASWLVFGATAFVSGSALASVGVLLFLGVFALGEMVQQPVLPALASDLAPRGEEGRYNALQTGTFQAGSVLGPLVAGLLARESRAELYVASMVVGCLAIVVCALWLGRQLPVAVNSPSYDEPSRAEELAGPQR